MRILEPLQSFKKLKKQLDRKAEISRKAIDEFLLYYAAQKDGLDRRFDNKVKRFRHITNVMPDGWQDYLKSQYIVHRIFKSNGLISKYLKHSNIQSLSVAQREFLEEQKEHPWSYSFAEIVNNPHPDFYNMRDIFTGEEYLLYSQSISKTLLHTPDVRTWFNLVSFGNECCMTYGSVSYFQSFDYNDISFFAHELDPDLKWNEEIANHINEHPLPYSMLFSGAKIPLIMHQDYRIRHIAARYYDDDFSSDPFRELFRVEYDKQVYRLSLEKWSNFPHFAIAYFDEREAILHLTAMTVTGFEKLVKAVNNCGYDLSIHPHDNVSPGMLSTASDILRRDITINPFENLFDPKTENEQFDELNVFLELLIESFNNKQEPDIREMAEKAGLDVKTAISIAEQVAQNLNKQ